MFTFESIYVYDKLYPGRIFGLAFISSTASFDGNAHPTPPTQPDPDMGKIPNSLIDLSHVNTWNNTITVVNLSRKLSILVPFTC